MRTYQTILQGSEATIENAYNFATLYDFSKDHISDQKIAFKTFIDTVNDIDIWYDYGADYYFFALNEAELLTKQD